MKRTLIPIFCMALAACGNISRKQRDAGNQPDDSAMNGDGTMAGSDAMVVQVAPTPAREVVSGAGHMSSTTYKLDVEIGVPFTPQPMTGAVHTMQANTAVEQ